MTILRFIILSCLLVMLGACAHSKPEFLQAFDPRVYIVQSGDTVYSIAWRHGRDTRDIIYWNRLSKPYTIYPGQKLKVSGKKRVPASDGSTQTAAQSKQGSAQAGGAKTTPLKKSQKSTSASTPPKTSKTSKTPEVITSGKKWIWPVKGKILTHFSATKLGRQGVDIKGSKGGAVVASRGGKVVYSGTGMRNYGRLVIIKHNATFLSAYAHNSKLLVKEGDTVKAGQAIAQIGVSNRGVAKLHFEIRRDGKPVNPLKFLPRR